MRDKVTKKRIKVDYELMIIYLKKDAEFVRYLYLHPSKISQRRLALAFLRTLRVDIESTYFEMKDKGLLVDQDRTQALLGLELNGATYAELNGDEPCCIDNTPDFLRNYK